jgi:hypothetical protein
MLYRLDQVRKVRNAFSNVSTKNCARLQVAATYKYIWGGAVSEKGGAVNNTPRLVVGRGRTTRRHEGKPTLSPR